MALKDRLATLREGQPRGWQAALARYCNVTPVTVNDWLSGNSLSIDSVNLFLAAEFLKVRPMWLATGEGPKDIGPSAEPGAESISEQSRRYALSIGALLEDEPNAEAKQDAYFALVDVIRQRRSTPKPKARKPALGGFPPDRRQSERRIKTG